MSTQLQTHASPVTGVRDTLSIEQVRHLLALTAEDPKLRDLHDAVSIISWTGIRMIELIKLRWSDLSFRDGWASITQSKTWDRRIPLGPKTLHILEALRSRKRASEFVFGKSPSARLQGIARQLRVVAGKVGAPTASFSVLRHTFFLHLVLLGDIQVPAQRDR
jgi:integrase